MEYLIEEIEGLEAAATFAKQLAEKTSPGAANRKYVLSAGATPTATSVQNLLRGDTIDKSSETYQQVMKLKGVIERANSNAHTQVEIHAGVYPTLDMQQLATQASLSSSASPDKQLPLSTSDIALSVIAEVASLYPHRDRPEALVAAGSLALGREPCKSYSGWGIVSDWGMPSCNGENRSGWEVGRISQEHGILTKDSTIHAASPELEIGQKVRIWPNHACITAAGYGWFLIVDSTLPEDRQNEVVDIWVRWRGW